LRAVKLIGGGRVLAHAENATWMVRGGLPGEVLRVRPTRRRARIVEADTIALVAGAHPARLDAPCPHAESCGGCDWPHVDNLAGALLKRDVAAEAAGRFPEIADSLRRAPVTDSPPEYRLRSRLHWDPGADVLGFYAPRSRRVSPISGCRVVSRALAHRLPLLTEVLGRRCPVPVDLEVLEGDDTTVAALRPARGGPRSITKSWIPSAGDNLDLGGFHRLAGSSRRISGWGRQTVRIDLPIPLEVPIGSFFQGNRHLVPWLFDRLTSLIGSGPEPVFDLHGGVGFLAAAARAAGREELTVVEPHETSASAAGRNLPNATVVASSAEAFVERQRELPEGALVITDPPRSGLTRELRGLLTRWRPTRVVMLGCDPATWARDAAHLIDHEYVLGHIELVDLFPSTHHVEVLAVLESE
jgi:23S rRNA (uracil1939-C5)-methyltransferase